MDDLIERNLQLAIQCCLDIANRIVSMEETRKPSDYGDSLIALDEVGVIQREFARRLAPLAGFRNILVHEYIEIDRREVHRTSARYKTSENVRSILANGCKSVPRANYS